MHFDNTQSVRHVLDRKKYDDLIEQNALEDYLLGLIGAPNDQINHAEYTIKSIQQLQVTLSIQYETADQSDANQTESD